jgi:hypothetical protein
MDLARWFSHEDCNAIHGLFQSGAQNRYLGARVFKVVAGLLHGQFVA